MPKRMSRNDPMIHDVESGASAGGLQTTETWQRLTERPRSGRAIGDPKAS